MNDLGLVEAIDRLGEGIFESIAIAADGRLDACFGQTLGLSNADAVQGAAFF